MQDRRDQLDLLLVALRELIRSSLAELRDTEAVEPVKGLATRAVRCHAVERGEVDELIDHEHPRVEPAFLGEIAPGRARQASTVDAIPRHRPGIGREHAEDDPHRRGLARPVRAEEAEHLAARDLERQAVERDDRAEALVEVIDHQAHQPRIAATRRERARTMVPLEAKCRAGGRVFVYQSMRWIPGSALMEVSSMRFALLLYGDEAAESALSRDEQLAIMNDHLAFAAKLRDLGKLPYGDALAASSNATLVRPGRGVTDGPFAETKEQLGGLYVVDCADRDEAIELARQLPNSPGLVIEIRPIMET